MRSIDSFVTTAYVGEIGLAREDITPPPGIYARNWGRAQHDVTTGVHRPLTATACAFVGSGSAPLILLAADLGWWKNPEDEWLVRGALLAGLKLDPSQLLLSLSHTHAGPGLYREDAPRTGGALIAPYLAQLTDRLLAAARAALAQAQPARLSWRYGRCDLAQNRDLPELGTTRYLVGHNPAFAADDTLLVGRIETATGARPLATLVNYACHPTTLAWDNPLISPDYPGALRETVENATGAPCLFLQGASGELAPAEQYLGDPAVADRHGRRLGYAVLSVLAGWPQALQAPAGVVESGAPLAVTRHAPEPTSTALGATLAPIALPLKPLPTVAEIEAQLLTCTDRAIGERLWRQRGVRRSVGDGTSAPLSLWVWRLGEAVLVAAPSEAYSALQLELRTRFPGRIVAVLNLTNGSLGYLPPHQHYERNQYAVWQTPFAAGSLEALIAAATTRVAQVLASS